MLTLKRFRAMVDSYGANLQRWPEERRSEAQKLLNTSAEARDLLVKARALDEVIETARAVEDARRWSGGERDAALARLRAGVASRIAASTPRARPGRGLRPARSARWMLAFPLRAAGMAAAGGCAIIAGLLIGSVYVSEPVTDGMLALLLQPAPIDILSD
jgi:hypothetical protein